VGEAVATGEARGIVVIGGILLAAEVSAPALIEDDPIQDPATSSRTRKAAFSSAEKASRWAE
jgi:hypothetical protein